MPHEWLCGGLLLFLWLRVVSAGGFLDRDGLSLLLILLLNILMLAVCTRRQSDRYWRSRLLFYALAMNLLYFLLGSAVPKIHPAMADEALQAVDQWLIGTHAAFYLERWVHPVVTEIFSFCYLWYLVYLFSSQIEYLSGDIEDAKAFYTGMFSIYAIGYLGYATVPALGPYLAMAEEFQVPLEGGWFTHITAQIVNSASNHVDIFPSLHVANSLYILLFDYRHKRCRFWLYLLPCTSLVIATLYLRYHYVIDVLSGIVLSLAALWLAHRLSTAEDNKKEINIRVALKQKRAHHRSVRRHRLRAGKAVRV